MAINKAVDALLAEGGDVYIFNKDAVWRVASDLIRVAQRLQAGDLHTIEKQDSEEAPF
jgi:hypothetical protein